MELGQRVGVYPYDLLQLLDLLPLLLLAFDYQLLLLSKFSIESVSFVLHLVPQFLVLFG